MNAFGDVVSWLGTGSHWTGPDGVLHQLGVHLALSAIAVAIAGAIALPLGLWLGHVGRGGALAINVSNVGRAIPTFAVLVLLSIGPLGINSRAVVVSLVLFAIPPLLTNTYVGMREVDSDVKEAALGVGMSGGEMLRRVELPLALPLLMAGVRIAVVQVVATTTIAALVGGGGLGRLVVDGLAQHDRGQELSGALLVAVLALLCERLLTLAERRLEPQRRGGGDRAAPVAEDERVVVTTS